MITAEKRRTKGLEKRSDEFAFASKHDVMKGAISPTALDDLLRCVDEEDRLLLATPRTTKKTVGQLVSIGQAGLIRLF